MLPKIQGILFDMDGTLCDSGPLITELFRTIYESYAGVKLSDDAIHAKYGPGGESVIFAKDFGELSPEIMEHYLQMYSCQISKVSLPEGLMNFLNMAHHRDIQLGIVTNKERESTLITLRRLRLSDFFRVIITSDQVVQPKPSPEGINLALQQWALDPNQVLMIGDTLADAIAAVSAGIHFVGASWFPDYPVIHGHLQVTSILDLERLLDFL